MWAEMKGGSDKGVECCHAASMYVGPVRLLLGSASHVCTLVANNGTWYDWCHELVYVGLSVLNDH